MQPNKLKTGYGEGICTVLLALCEVSVNNKIRFKKPNIKDGGAGGFGEADDDEFGEDFEGNADIADMYENKDKGGDDSDDIDEDVEYGAGQIGQNIEEQEMLKQEILHSSIEKDKWMLEVERVAHKLKINNAAVDGKEWRAHMDQTKKFHESVKSSLPEVRGKLERLSDDVSRALEKIGKRESILTRSFQGMTGDYRAHSDKLKDIQNNFKRMTKNVQDLETELMDINERLTKI